MDSHSHWIAWAAGIVDGEGCIHLCKREGAYYVRLDVANTDIAMLHKLKELFGGAVNGKASGRDNRRPVWSWQVSHKTADTALRSMLPWFVTKRSQAEAALLARQYMGRAQSAGVKRKPQDVEVLALIDTRLRILKREPSGEAPLIELPEEKQRWLI